MSRVTKSKGLDTLAAIYNLISNNVLARDMTIDFFGQKNDSYFDNHLEQIPIYRYKGVLAPDKVIETLKQYDALIFPTHYDGEGCPGILIEALSVGLPIIASDWKYNSEFVTDGVNGFLCDTFDASQYVDALSTLYHNPHLRGEMGKNSRIKARNFSANTARNLLSKIL